MAGAQGITCHLREDRRHIQDRDLTILRHTVRTILNLEMGATEEMLAIATNVKPDLVTLVPEKRAERTTEGGLDVAGGGAALATVVGKLHGAGIAVALFIDPQPAQIRASAALRVSRVELHTGHFTEARGPAAGLELDRLANATEEALSLGMRVAAGHGLDYPNVGAVATIPGIEELNIGQAIVARAVFVGLDRAVRDMVELCRPTA